MNDLGAGRDTKRGVMRDSNTHRGDNLLCTHSYGYSRTSMKNCPYQTPYKRPVSNPCYISDNDNDLLLVNRVEKRIVTRGRQSPNTFVLLFPRSRSRHKRFNVRKASVKSIGNTPLLKTPEYLSRTVYCDRGRRQSL